MNGHDIAILMQSNCELLEKIPRLRRNYFRLFMSTRDTSVVIPPDATSIVSSVNFTTTRAGMTSQLLAAALKHEKPELELRKSELLKVEEEHKLEIGRLEDFLLEELANATGNLLENKELLASLNETKSKSASIQVRKNPRIP